MRLRVFVTLTHTWCSQLTMSSTRDVSGWCVLEPDFFKPSLSGCYSYEQQQIISSTPQSCQHNKWNGHFIPKMCFGGVNKEKHETKIQNVNTA